MASLGNLPREFDDLLAEFVKRNIARIILVANNHLINNKLVDILDCQPDDLIVQFNRSPHFELFKSIKCHKVHVFNQADGKWWGFSSEEAPSHDYLSQQSTTLSFLFKFYGVNYNRLSPNVIEFLETHAMSVSGGALRLADIPNTAYPKDKAHSIGYLTVCYFRYINMLRFLMRRPVLPLIAAGFSGKYPPGGAWNGHDFGFEQKAYLTWLDLSLLDHDGQPALRPQ